MGSANFSCLFSVTTMRIMYGKKTPAFAGNTLSLIQAPIQCGAVSLLGAFIYLEYVVLFDNFGSGSWL